MGRLSWTDWVWLAIAIGVIVAIVAVTANACTPSSCGEQCNGDPACIERCYARCGEECDGDPACIERCYAALT